MKYLFILLLFSCTKNEVFINEIPCANAFLISEKYSQDSTFIKRDTLWHDYVCFKELDSIRAKKDVWFVECSTKNIEHWYYVIKPR